MACLQISSCFNLTKKLTITNTNTNINTSFKSLTFSNHLSDTTFSYGNLAMKGGVRQYSRSVVCEAGTTKKADSAAKRARQSEKRRVYNKSKKSEMKTRMKKTNVHLLDNGNVESPMPLRLVGSSSDQRSNGTAIVKKESIKKTGKREHHLWMKKDSAGSGQKALNLVRIVSELPNEKEIVYATLDKWTAWETEFPLIAAAKALRILEKRNQWLRLIQVGKWMLSRGQGLTMGTYDLLLLAFDMDRRVEEAESLWNMIVSMHTRSVSKRLFSRIVSLYDHHSMPNKIIEVFTDMEELGVKPDEDTVRKVAHAFGKLGDEGKQELVLKKYLNDWKYIHYNGERVKVRRWQE